jgi:hypothetical protein
MAHEDKTNTDNPASDDPKADDLGAALRPDVVDVDRIDLEERVAKVGAAHREELGLAWEPNEDGLPPYCPVRPLGMRGGSFYFLTPAHEVRTLTAGEFGQGHIDALFAPKSDYVVAMWGAASKQNKLRVQYEAVRRSLMDACGRRGVFDLAERARGRGAWKGRDGDLILHYGDRLVIGGRIVEPGLHEGYVYPGRPPLPPPLGDGRAEARAAARRLLELLQGWRWSRGALDARLMLGWVVASLMGAAVDWRPQIMLTGDAGMGKSTLQHLLKAVLGERVLDVADASAAGLYQTLQYDALAVAFDEFENEDEARVAAVMRLARLASSGGRLVRGGADGVPSNYQARGAFLFSAINPPAMRPAEQSRSTILALRPPEPGAKPPVFTADEAARIGAMLAQRVITAWSMWPERLAKTRLALARMAHTNRAQDQVGTLLAAADLALHDHDLAIDEIERDGEHLRPGQLAETSGGAPNWRRCLNHALFAQPDAWRSAKYKSVGAALSDWMHQAPDAWETGYLRQMLAVAGMALVSDASAGRGWLALPYRHPALAKLFEGTDWAGRRGADGGWVTALTQAPDGAWKRDQFRIGGPRERGVLIRVDLAIEPLDPPAPAPIEAAIDDDADECPI